MRFRIILAVQNVYPGDKTACLRPDRNDELRQDFDLGHDGWFSAIISQKKDAQNGRLFLVNSVNGYSAFS